MVKLKRNGGDQKTSKTTSEKEVTVIDGGTEEAAIDVEGILDKEEFSEDEKDKEFGEESYEVGSSENDEESEKDDVLSEISFKLVINQKGKNSSAKWVVIHKTIFRNFLNDLYQHVQQQLDQWVERDDYVVIYKQVNDKGLATQLSDEKDWEMFLLEYQKSISRKKEMMVLITFKFNENESDKIHLKKRRTVDSTDTTDTTDTIQSLRKKKGIKEKSNAIPKETNLSEERTKLATNIMLITQKYHCDEHDRACYITGSNHLFLTPQHLSTWAASIEHNLATIDTPPSFPIFANKTTKSNKNTSQSSPSRASVLQHMMYPYPITMYPYSVTPQITLPPQAGLSSQTPVVSDKSIPTINEFLQNLDNEYGNGNFTCLLDSFLNESIDVLDILELNDDDFVKLGIDSIGVRKKLIRAAKHYISIN